MTSEGYLVDTDVLSETAKPTPSPAVLEWLAGERRLFVSAVTVFELARGIEAVSSSNKRRFLEQWLAEILDGPFDLVAFDAQAALAAARIDAEARRRGRPIDTRDLFILATAHQKGLRIATHNVRHFRGHGVRLFDPWTGIHTVLD